MQLARNSETKNGQNKESMKAKNNLIRNSIDNPVVSIFSANNEETGCIGDFVSEQSND